MLNVSIFYAASLRLCSLTLPPSTLVSEVLEHCYREFSISDFSFCFYTLQTANGLECDANSSIALFTTALSGTLQFVLLRTLLSSDIVEQQPDVQQRLLDEIHRRNLEENFANGIEFNPESFGSITMLYVACEVNRTSLTAFVDTGAQMSIMSQACAERCGILRLVDSRFGGVARGVGEAKILGRVHVTLLKLGSLMLPFSVAVLEHGIDLILGLDQMRRHQMSIDLFANVLRIGDQSIPFLSEDQLNVIPENATKASSNTTTPEEACASNGTDGDTSTAAPVNPLPVCETGELQNEERSRSAAATSEQDKIRQIVDAVGCTHVEAKGALNAAEGDVETAINVLLY